MIKKINLKLNLGCGFDIRKGYINVDHVKEKSELLDIVHNLNKFPYPFKNNSAKEILMRDSLEHLENPEKVLHELKRILADDGSILIRVPHFTSRYGFTPYHKTFWSYFVIMNQFSTNTKSGTFESEKMFYIKNSCIVFDKTLIFRSLIEKIVNINYLTRQLYECYFCFIFPAHSIDVTFTKKDIFIDKEIMGKILCTGRV